MKKTFVRKATSRTMILLCKLYVRTGETHGFTYNRSGSKPPSRPQERFTHNRPR